MGGTMAWVAASRTGAGDRPGRALSHFGGRVRFNAACTEEAGVAGPEFQFAISSESVYPEADVSETGCSSDLAINRWR